MARNKSKLPLPRVPGFMSTSRGISGLTERERKHLHAGGSPDAVMKAREANKRRGIKFKPGQ